MKILCPRPTRSSSIRHFSIYSCRGCQINPGPFQKSTYSIFPFRDFCVAENPVRGCKSPVGCKSCVLLKNLMCGCKSHVFLQIPCVAANILCSCKSHVWLQIFCVPANLKRSCKSCVCACKSCVFLKISCVSENSMCFCKSCVTANVMCGANPVCSCRPHVLLKISCVLLPISCVWFSLQFVPNIPHKYFFPLQKALGKHKGGSREMKSKQIQGTSM